MSWVDTLEKHGMGWLMTDIMYRMDWSKPNPSSVKGWLAYNLDWALRNPNEIFMSRAKTRDGAMVSILNNAQRLTYVSDKEKFGLVEKWEHLKDLLATGKGDCENHAQYIYTLARMNRINIAQIRFVCGWYIDYGEKTGHAWVEYLADEDMEWHILDATNKYQSIHNIVHTPLITHLDKVYVPWWYVSDQGMFRA
jgi:hypothetical protein